MHWKEQWQDGFMVGIDFLESNRTQCQQMITLSPRDRRTKGKKLKNYPYYCMKSTKMHWKEQWQDGLMEGIDFQELNRTQHQQMITLSFKDRRIKEQETIKVKWKAIFVL